MQQRFYKDKRECAKWGGQSVNGEAESSIRWEDFACIFDIVDCSELNEDERKTIERYSFNFISWPERYFEENTKEYLGVPDKVRTYLAEVQRIGTLMRTGRATEEEMKEIKQRLKIAGRKNRFKQVMQDVVFYETYEEFLEYVKVCCLIAETEQLTEDIFLNLQVKQL